MEGRSRNRVLGRILPEEVLVGHRLVVELTVEDFWIVEEFTVGWMHVLVVF